MNKRILKLLSLILSICLVFAAFVSCAKEETNTPEKINPPKEQSSDSNQEQSSAAAPDSKYGEAEVYQNDKGNPAAKTEDGTEVELTGESMESIYSEYEKVKGSGSEKERELLDKLQLILEAPRN